MRSGNCLQLFLPTSWFGEARISDVKLAVFCRAPARATDRVFEKECSARFTGGFAPVQAPPGPHCRAPSGAAVLLDHLLFQVIAKRSGGRGVANLIACKSGLL